MRLEQNVSPRHLITNASLWAVLALLLALSLPAEAAVRISGGVGFGSTTSKNDVSESEGPLTQNYTFESPLHSGFLIGVEHLRSLQLGPVSTAMSFTGVFGRYYLNNMPSPYARTGDLLPDEIIMRDVAFYLSLGLGLGQSNRLPTPEGKSSNAAGIYLSPRAGTELALSRNYGVRSELAIAMTVFGSGTLTSFSLLGAVYYVF